MAAENSVLAYFRFNDAANVKNSGFAMSRVAPARQYIIALDPLAFPTSVNVSATLHWKAVDHVVNVSSTPFTFPIAAGSTSFNNIACPLNSTQGPVDGLINVPIINYMAYPIPANGYTRIRSGRGQYGYYHPSLADVCYTSAQQSDVTIATGGGQGPVLRPGSTTFRVTVIDSAYTLSYEVGAVYFEWDASGYRDDAGSLSTLSSVTLNRRWNVLLRPNLKLTVHYFAEQLSSGSWVVTGSNPATSTYNIDSQNLYTKTLDDDEGEKITPYVSGYALTSGKQWSAEFTKTTILDPASDTVSVSES